MKNGKITSHRKRKSRKMERHIKRESRKEQKNITNENRELKKERKHKDKDKSELEEIEEVKNFTDYYENLSHANERKIMKERMNFEHEKQCVRMR